MNEQSPAVCQFAGFRNDGTVIVYIDGKRYVYITDAVYHEKWQRMLATHPSNAWRILNQIKEKVKSGDWKQIEPKLVYPDTPTSVLSKVQKTFNF
jgi:hypothetical protein